MSEYWLISAPGDKTMQQTWETMNNVTSKQNNLCENFKFHIPDLKVGTLDQLVGLSDDLGKLDAYVEQTTRKISAYLGDVLEDQRDKLYENLQANNSLEGSVDEPSAPSTPVEPPVGTTFGGSKEHLTAPEDQHHLGSDFQRQYSSSHSHEGGTTTSSSRHGSLTNSSSSACSAADQRGLVYSCPTSINTPTTPCSPTMVSSQFGGGGGGGGGVVDPFHAHPDSDSGWWDADGGRHKSKHRHSPKPPASPNIGEMMSHSRKGSCSSSQQGHADSTSGRASICRPPPPDGDGYSAPETEHGQESMFEWRWFHRRKHSHKSRSRSSSHLFGGSGHGSGHGLVGTSSCCGGRPATGDRHDRPSSPEPDGELDVYGGAPSLEPACPLPPPHPGGGPTASSALARNGLRLRKRSTVAAAAAKRQPPAARLAAVINPDDLTSYITRFQWDLAKYPTKQSLRNIADIISKQVGQIDADLKTKSAAYNNLKGNLQNLEKKQTGSLLTRNLADLVKKEHFILDSEYLTTLLVIVPKANINDWNAHYEKITDMIVPRSSQLIMQDADYALVNVTLFKKVVDEFKLHARERKFVVREFVYNEEELAAGKNEITKLVTDKKKQFGPLVRWLKVNFSECFCAWVHVKALRVFVESVLRYGLPVNFQAILIHPNKKSTKRLRDVLQQLYGHLDGSGSSSGGNADNVDIPGLGFGQSEYFPYVYYKLNIDMIETKV